GKPLPEISTMLMEFLVGGDFKYLYNVFYESEPVFTVGVKNEDFVFNPIEYQFNNILVPSYSYWQEKVSSGLIPVPEPGSFVVLDIGDIYDKGVFTNGYLPGMDRFSYIEYLRQMSVPDQDIAEICFRQESRALYMIWKATNGVVVDDLYGENVIYVEGWDGVYYPKLFDFDVTLETGFEGLFVHAVDELKLEIKNIISSADLVNTQALLGFFDAMRLDGMRINQILDLLDTLTGVDADAVAEAKAIIASDYPIDWIESLPDETREIKNYARLNIENALYAQGLLYNICLEGSIDINAISEVFGVFGMAGEYCYEYFMIIKTADSKFYYFDVSVLKAGLNPGAYNVNSVVNFRNSLYFQDPSLTGTSFGAVLTDMGMPVEAHQPDDFCYNLPPQMFTDLMLGEEIVTWWSEKYLQDAGKVGFLDALEVASLSNNGVPWAALEAMFGVPQDTLLAMVGDVNIITGDYPDIFTENDFKTYLRNKKLTHFDAYTIWYMSYILGKSTLDLSKLYNIQNTAVPVIVDRVTSLYVPVDLIEERLRSEWIRFFDSV
ncbi:MAG: hypothetical protein KAI03_05875, partial [Candidatus Aureabacteria bacterium]|nr:hypothetical protein [Candidatus Auribacterota bacterium]